MITRVLKAGCFFLTISIIFGVEFSECNASESEFRASSLIVTDSLPNVVVAIKKSFESGTYHGKRLSEFPYNYVVSGQTRVAVPQTNVWNLGIGPMPLRLLKQGTKWVAYDEGFEIRAEAADLGGTRIVVTPTESETTGNSYGLSPHFNFVLREEYHSPIGSETTNLFNRIESQLKEFHAGRVECLPPTLDMGTDFYRYFWTGMDAKKKHDRRNWEKMVEAWKKMQNISEDTNSAGTVTNRSR